MLRHTMLVSLAMTACATFIPTRANAISVTFTPIDTVQKNPGESITFQISFDPGIFASVIRPRVKDYIFDWDHNELEFSSQTPHYDPGIVLTESKIIADITFSVLPGVVRGGNDFYSVSAIYTTENVDGQEGSHEFSPFSLSSVDVVPVPEPLTIFGSGMGLGLGVLFKKNVQGNRKKAKSF